MILHCEFFGSGTIQCSIAPRSLASLRTTSPFHRLSHTAKTTADFKPTTDTPYLRSTLKTQYIRTFVRPKFIHLLVVNLSLIGLSRLIFKTLPTLEHDYLRTSPIPSTTDCRHGFVDAGREWVYGCYGSGSPPVEIRTR
jgi:hypothetical protein